MMMMMMNSVGGSEKNRFNFSCVRIGTEKTGCVATSHTVGVRSDVRLPLHMHTTVFTTGQWLRRR